MASTVPRATKPRGARSSRFLACTVAAAVARIGVISGATSIAPITTAEESDSNPNAAIDDDREISAQKRTA